MSQVLSVDARHVYALNLTETPDAFKEEGPPLDYRGGLQQGLLPLALDLASQ